MIERIELGCAGHFICASRCLFRRHTQVGRYRVSTVGDFFLTGDSEREEIGLNRFFETMVFETGDTPEAQNEGCGCKTVIDYLGVDMAGYNTAGEAQAGHEAMVEKYLELQKETER